MRQKIYTTLVMLFAVSLISCIRVSSDDTRKIEEGDGFLVYETGKFNSLTVCAVDLFVTVGEPDGLLRIEADNEILDDIAVENRGGILSVNDRDNAAVKKGKPRAKIYITVDKLDEIYATQSTVYLDKNIVAETHVVESEIKIGD